MVRYSLMRRAVVVHSMTWRLAESQSLRFSWETFNVANSVRFGIDLANGDGFPSLGTTGTFGEYN